MTTIRDFLHVFPPVELKSAVVDGVVAGYGCTFGNVIFSRDKNGDRVEPGAFAPSIQRFKAEGSAPLMLWGHDPDRVIGKWTDFAEDGHGLKVRGQFNLGTTAGRDAHAHVKAGDLDGLSIGFNVPPGGFKRDPNGTRILSIVDFHEVSIVAFPANPLARVTEVKSAFSSRSELETLLREHLPARAVKKLLSGGWSAVSGDDEADDDSALTELVAAVRASRLDLKGS